MSERAPKAPKQDNKEGQRLKHGEDYGARGLHGEAGTKKEESVRNGGGITRDHKGGSEAASKGRPTTPGQSQEDKDAIAERLR